MKLYVKHIADGDYQIISGDADFWFLPLHFNKAMPVSAATLCEAEERYGVQVIELLTEAPSMTEERQTLINQLDAMARQFDYWREFNCRQRAKEGLETAPDTFLARPPHWPTHNALEAWSDALDRARAALSN